MALVLQTNVPSLRTQRSVEHATQALEKTFERLSSGLRINHASDDSAGMSISTRMTSQIRGLNQAGRNANDAISLVQVAESSLEETTTALQRIRELTVQAANDSYSSSDRADIQKEVNQLISEIDRISDHTSFDGQKLLNGSFTGKKFQVGAYSGQYLSITISALNAAGIGINALSNAFSGTAASVITALLSTVDTALEKVTTLRSKLGAYQNRFEVVVANLSNMSEAMSASRSRITDTDIASETANLTRNMIMQQASTAMLAQANQQPQVALLLLK
ncbi:MAG: flagellin FliC [Magnetococcales bacterium]|nr:flagellin FliC [Magnetococcales bacterium]